MRDIILQNVKTFLEKHYQKKGIILLGFSGGADSMALLHAFLECRSFFFLDLQVVHIDHGWRQESAEQASYLQEMVKALNISFHLYTLKPPQEGKNLEDRARQERLKIFSDLYKQVGAEALALGHHADDQAETVLKRVLEGSSIIEGIKERTTLHEMQIFRPLLTLSKKQILKFLQKRGLSFIDDPTNRDPQFLRSRMRSHILPDLSKSFGKEIGKNLCKLGHWAAEVNNYLEKRVFSLLNEESPDLSLLESVEIKTFLKLFSKKNGFHLSHEQQEILTEHLLTKSPFCQIISGPYLLLAKRGRLFLKDKL